MATTELQGQVKDPSDSKRGKDTTESVNVTHNNARLYVHTDLKPYEFVGLDGSGNRIYRNHTRA